MTRILGYQYIYVYVLTAIFVVDLYIPLGLLWVLMYAVAIYLFNRIPIQGQVGAGAGITIVLFLPLFVSKLQLVAPEIAMANRMAVAMLIWLIVLSRLRIGGEHV